MSSSNTPFELTSSSLLSFTPLLSHLNEDLFNLIDRFISENQSIKLITNPAATSIHVADTLIFRFIARTPSVIMLKIIEKGSITNRRHTLFSVELQDEIVYHYFPYFRGKLKPVTFVFNDEIPY